MPYHISPRIYNHLIQADETIAQEITLDVGNRVQAECLMIATTATIFYVDVSDDGTNWVNVYTSSVAETEKRYATPMGARFIRVRSDAAGAAGDLVSLFISAKH